MYIDSDYLQRADAIAAGANPACLPPDNDDPDEKSPGIELDSIVVIQSDGTEVWRWNVRDHLIQDFDSSKANYGEVADHPERIDINYGLCRQHASFNDFLKAPHHLTHLNSIDYNAELDQILITSRHFSEVWVIDASTTTAEAATDADGTYGKGGRLLYRAGNPRTHRAGDKHDQTLFFPHNAHWIPADLPGAGNVLVYNNGFEHPGFLRNWASVDEWALPELEGKYVQVGSGYMAPTTVWSYFMPQRTWLMSNAQRLSNGNTLVVEGEHDRITEVTAAGEVVWHYRSPLVRGMNVLATGWEPNAPGDVWIYRSYKYASNYAGITALTLIPEADRTTLEGARAAQPVISIAGGSAVTEGNAVTFTLTATPAPAAPLTVSVSVAATGDFGVTPGSQEVTIPTTGSATLSVPTTNDSADELDGTVTATISSSSSCFVSPTDASAIVAVADDEVPELSITGGGTVTEGTAASFTLTANPLPASALTVNVSVTQDGDFGATGSQTVTIPTTGSATLTVSTTGDEVEEDDGSVTATVNVGSGYTVSSTAGSATVTIEDDDQACVLSLPSDAITVSEVENWRDDFSHAEHVQRWNRVLAALDPTKGNGETAMTAADAATIKQEFDNARWDRTLRTLTEMERCSTPPPAVPEVRITAGSAVTEGGTATFTLTANPAPAAPLSVSVAVSQSGNFGVTPSTQTVTISTTGSGTLSVVTSDDSVDEPHGSVTATVSTGTGYTVSTTAGSASVAVNDDDDPSPTTPVISINPGSGVTEGHHATFTLTAIPAPSAALSVTVAVSQSGDFGVATGSQTVTIPTSGSFTLTVSTTNDSADEADGSVTATVSTGTGYTVSQSNGAASVSVRDDDVPEISIAAGAGVTEGGNATFTLTATPTPHAPLSVSVTVSQSGDFGVTPGARTVSIGTSGRGTLTVATADDSLNEANGSVSATVNGGAGYTVSSSNSATVAVADDDPTTPGVTVSIGDAAADEDDGKMTFTVTLSKAAAHEIHVRWDTATHFGAAHSAYWWDDYWITDGQHWLVFAAGETSKTGQVNIEDDNAPEQQEAFLVQLLEARGASISDGEGVMTINDDD